MFVNCKQFLKDSHIKIYNLSTAPIVGVSIYIISENSDIYLKTLEHGIDLDIDSEKFKIEKGKKGESPLSPITYKRNIYSSRLRIHDAKDKIIGLIVGSNKVSDQDSLESVPVTYGDFIYGNYLTSNIAGAITGENYEWIRGINLNHLDDFIKISINWRGLDYETVEYLSSGLIIAVDPILLSINSISSNVITNPNSGGKTTGYGTGAYGSGPFGGVTS
jgi:hypothetical protein